MDIKKTKKYFDIIVFLSLEELRQRYRRSSLGPFWITISIGIQMLTMGVVFSFVFNIGVRDYLPYLGISLILWNFISSSIQSGCNSFISSGHLIRQIPFPLLGHVVRSMSREVFVFAHNAIVIPALILMAQGVSIYGFLLSMIGLAIMVANLFWISLISGIVCLRFRDIGQIVGNALQIIFYLTPIMWKIEMIPIKLQKYLNFNPVYVMIESVRGPLLNTSNYSNIFNILLINMALLIFGGLLSAYIFKQTKNKIAYWV